MNKCELLDLTDEIGSARTLAVALQAAAASLPDRRMMSALAELGSLIEARLDSAVGTLNARIEAVIEGEA
ncbi:hypothetical protein [Zavarzinia aquatilis]|uniref:Uncharacterized protein n=1 Tax=Zavarzinia aquatilis TaxID=2211142 RepID=A0A317EB88_9PROT|nr:hypothetical protein [Zavarzinia aquatilis]PWR24209.1 hypothetical protein DKG74_08810 [Zavarzinia aquatilis]